MLVRRSSGFSPILALVLLLLVGVGSAVAIKVISERPLPPVDSRATGGVKLNAPSAGKPAAPSESAKSAEKAVNLTNPKTLVVVTRPRSDGKAFIVEFTAASFSNVEFIDYSLTYESGEDSIDKGIQGTIASPVAAVDGTSKTGLQYIRRELVFGTCSKNVCVYDIKPRSFKLTVVTKLVKGGTEKIVTTLSL